MKKLTTIKMAASLLAVGLSFSVQAQSISIYADYNYNSSDNTSFRISNDGTSTLTGLQLLGVGTSGSVSGHSSSLSLSDIAGGNSFVYSFNGPTTSTSVFAYDPDDYFTGQVQYTLTGMENGSSFILAFSQTANASGGFVGFLGLDASGLIETDNSVAPTLVATTLAVAPVPEPSSLAFSIMGGVAGLLMFRRRTLN